MPKLDDAAYVELAKLLRQRVVALAPGWTGNNERDPGIVLLDLFAFLTESILYRANAIPERGRASAARLAQVAQALANDNAGQASHTLERTRYFVGRLLGVDDFRLEQDYFRERIRRLNRELHGDGVVRGLGVSVRHDDSGTSEVVVEPGFAIDARGEEIEVCGLATAGLPPTGQLLYVTLQHAEWPTRPQPVPDGQDTQFARIEEGFAVRVEAAPAGDAVALARLLRAQDGWRVDETFKPARVAARAT